MTGDLVLPIFFGGLAFAFVMLFLYLVARYQRQSRELLHAERMAAIEKGLPIPVEVFFDSEDGAERRGTDSAALQEALKRVPGNAFKTGMTLLFLGIGLVGVFRLAQPGWGHWAWGLVLALVGVADLVYWFTGGRLEWERGQAFQAEARRRLLGEPGAAAPPAGPRPTSEP